MAALDAGSKAAFSVGHQVGEIAREIYGPGTLIFQDGDSFTDAIARTAEAARQRPATLFEAVYRADDTLIIADVVRNDSDGSTRVVEVKSSTSAKDYQIEDATIQAHVMSKAGVVLDSVCIAHIDSSFVYRGNGDYRGLLTEADCTSTALERRGEAEKWIADARNTLLGPEPNIAPGRQCTRPFLCPFHDHCNPAAAGYPLECIPGLSATQRRKLSSTGVVDARDIPSEVFDSLGIAHLREAILTGAAYVDRSAASTLSSLGFPRYFLDFETISFAVPIWEGTRPYQALPFQWSLHVECAPGKYLHYGFLELGGGNPAKSVMSALIKSVGDEGPILVYTRYEQGVLRAMAQTYPELREGLERIISRLVDLHPITKAAYYHRDMQGSWSIKAVLPTIASELSYSDLCGVHDGLEAQSAYQEAIRPITTQERRAEIRQQLETYCKLDTLAMVAIANALSGCPERTPSLSTPLPA
jgi:hypothetical protein